MVWPADCCDRRVRLKAGRMQLGLGNADLTEAVAAGIEMRAPLKEASVVQSPGK